MMVLSPDGMFVAITHVNSGKISIFDGTVVKTVGINYFPISMLVSPDSKTLYADGYNDKGIELTVIDLATATIVHNYLL
jgi:DNA-binding beta-propeller fold protein YncE